MLTFNLDFSSKEPLYSQLYLAVREAIEGGEIAAGERLPSKREISSHLKISISTIENAYSQLCAEGYVRSKPGSGFYAERIPAKLCAGEGEPLNIESEPPEKKYRFDFGTNRADTGFFPFSSWAKLSRGVLSSQSEKLLNSCSPLGTRELRQEIAAYLKSFRGMNADPNQIVVGAGSEYLTGLIIQLLGRDTVCALENPGYIKTYKIFRQNCRKILPVDMDQNGADITKVFERADVFHITPSHHFPLGTVMPISRRHQLLNMVYSREGKYIIEDDYDSEFRFSGRPIPALRSMDNENRVIYINTFTKTLAPSMRISYMVLPPKLLEIYRKKLGFYACTVPVFEQFTLAEFMRKGYFERHINRMKKLYKKKRDAFLTVSENWEKRGTARVIGKDFGLHFVLDVRNGMDSKGLLESAEKNGVNVHGLWEYYWNEDRCSRGTEIVIGYSGMKEEEIFKGARELENIWGL